MGRDYVKPSDHSDEYAKLIDEEVKAIIDQAFKDGRKMLNSKRAELDTVAQALLDKETIDRVELLTMMGLPIPEKKVSPTTEETDNEEPKTEGKEDPEKSSPDFGDGVQLA